MAIIKDKNGLNIFCIPATGNNEGFELPSMDAYFLTLNEESYAFSNISKEGCHTSNYFDGTFIQNNLNEFGVILGHEFSPFIYRGQNKDYRRFVPTANRYGWLKREKIRKCIDWVKKREFLQLFKATPYYNRCQNFQVLNCKFKFDLEAVAQHYEFMSNYLDITKDLFVAMFFAYTYQKDGIYYPIQNFKRYSPTLYIGNLKTIYNKEPDCLKIIGFQSLLRPHLQKAMAIEIQKKDKVKHLFKKVKLPKSPVIAREIFEKANRGFNLFPNDPVGFFAKDVKSNKMLYKEYVEEFCSINKLNLEDVSKELNNLGYTFTDKTWDIPQNFVDAINNEIDNQIIPYINNKIAFRGVSKPLYPAERVIR